MQHQITALHAASLGGHYNIVQLLLEKGADLYARMDVSIIIILYVHVHVTIMKKGGYAIMKNS